MTAVTRLGAVELADLIDRRELTALEVTRAYLERIERLNGSIRALLRVNPRAEDDAREVDRGAAAPGPLRGVPIVVKDNLTTEGLVTTCGSKLLERFRPVRDATVTKRLRDTGAVILGKTNMDEFGMGSSNEHSAFGPTRNPWNPEHVPGGSSGGSAAAVSAGLAPLALGSDTGGSVRQPASFCGVTGLKPTYGRVSRSGLVAYGSSLEQVGPLASTTRDCARLLGVVAGADPADATSAAVPVDDYEAACDQSVTGMRVGWCKEHLGKGLDPEIATALQGIGSALERAGARLEEISLPHSRYALPAYYVLATAEASSNLARYDGLRYGTRVGPGDDLEGVYRATRGRGFGPEVKRRIMLGTYALSAGYYEAFYRKAARVRSLLRRDFLDVFESGVDLVIGPTTPTAAFRIGEKIDDPLAMYLSDVYTTTDEPHRHAGDLGSDGPAPRPGLPIGAQLIGPDFGEAALFRLGVRRRSSTSGPFSLRSSPGTTASDGPSPEPSGPQTAVRAPIRTVLAGALAVWTLASGRRVDTGRTDSARRGRGARAAQLRPPHPRPAGTHRRALRAPGRRRLRRACRIAA